MTILYHHRTLADGAEGIHIAAMVDAFRALGHEVVVSGLAAAPQPRKAALVGRIRAAIPTAAYELSAVGANVPEYAQILRDIRRVKPGMVYVRHSKYGTAAVSAARRCGIPAVLEVNCVFTAEPYYGFEPLAFRRLAARMEKQAFDAADVVLAVSTPLARQVRELSPANVMVLPNGVDLERFDVRRADAARVRARLNLHDRFVVGWSGILREWHGLHLLLDAVAELPSAVLLVVGDGPARAGVEGRAAALGIADRVIVTGRVPHAEMPDYQAAMDAAVVADERTGVASPMKLLEYMAMSRAVVAPRLENIEDVVQHDVTGLLFARGDRADLSAMVRRVRESAALRHALGCRARAYVERARSWERNAAVVLSAIHRPGAGSGVTAIQRNRKSS